MSGCLLIFRPAVRSDRVKKILEELEKSIKHGSVIGVNFDPGSSATVDFSIAGEHISLFVYIDPSSKKGYCTAWDNFERKDPKRFEFDTENPLLFPVKNKLEVIGALLFVNDQKNPATFLQ